MVLKELRNSFWRKRQVLSQSKNIKEFLDVMAHQCGGPNVTPEDIDNFKARVYSSIGFCSDYNYSGKEDKKNTQKNRAHHLEIYRTHHHSDMNTYSEVQFDDIFGMTIRTHH